jgi:hypothetical protein
LAKFNPADGVSGGNDFRLGFSFVGNHNHNPASFMGGFDKKEWKLAASSDNSYFFRVRWHVRGRIS